MKIDILKMELEEKLPHWLSPEMKFSELREEIRAKHRQRYLEEKRAEREREKSGES